MSTPAATEQIRLPSTAPVPLSGPIAADQAEAQGINPATTEQLASSDFFADWPFDLGLETAAFDFLTYRPPDAGLGPAESGGDSIFRSV